MGAPLKEIYIGYCCKGDALGFTATSACVRINLTVKSFSSWIFLSFYSYPHQILPTIFKVSQRSTVGFQLLEPIIMINYIKHFAFQISELLC